MFTISILIVCYFYVIYGNPSEMFFDIANTVSLYIVFTPIFLFLFAMLYFTINGDFDNMDDKCKCCCKCCCCKGDK